MDEQPDRSRQQEDAPPVVADPKLPTMDDRPRRPRRIKGELRMMADEPKPDKGSKGRMSPVPRGARAQREKAPKRLPEQEPKRERRAPKRERESYVRMRLLVEDGDMSLVGVREVDGPLAQPEQLHGGLTYEVSVGDRRLSVGSVPDAGVERSFPDPRRPEEGHHVTEVPSYEITVRIPTSELSRSALTRLQVALYRAKELTERPLTQARMADQFSRELREVARLKGVRRDALPSSVRRDLDRIFS